jgi:hypothetical protein
MIGGSAIKKIEKLGLEKLKDDDHAGKYENKIKCIGRLHEDHCD